MKVALSIKYIDGNPRFSDTLGNADEFFIYDVERKKIDDKFTNHFKSSPASEIFCAQILIKRGVNALVSQKCGRDAKNLFAEANVEVIENVGMKPTEYANILKAKYSQRKSVHV
jgi:predicted Fe-Mo cluster-binding NifX family protein